MKHFQLALLYAIYDGKQLATKTCLFLKFFHFSEIIQIILIVFTNTTNIHFQVLWLAPVIRDILQ